MVARFYVTTEYFMSQQSIAKVRRFSVATELAKARRNYVAT